MFDNLDWAEVEAQEEYSEQSKRWVDLPPGTYDVTIDKVSFEPAKVSKNGKEIPPFIAYDLTVVSDSEFKGYGTSKRDGFWNATSASFIKRDILRLGCEIPKVMEEIPLALNSVIGSIVSINVVISKGTSTDFRNIYIRSLKGKPEAGVKPAPSKVRITEPMRDSTADRLNAVAGATAQPVDDPFGGVFDSDWLTPPF